MGPINSTFYKKTQQASIYGFHIWIDFKSVHFEESLQNR